MPIVAATPDELHAAGVAFQHMSNAYSGLAGTPEVQSGGELETEVFGVPDFSLPHFPHAMSAVAQGFLGVLLAGRMQFADAAMDLFQVAGDFQKAGGQGLPAGAIPQNIAHPAGVTVFETESGEYYYRDRDGTYAKAPDNDYLSHDHSAVIVGETYRPHTGA